ncbi:MAG: hypothetical protein PUG33_02660 [Mollicutes bacterium]|nr:hypothetical protein [Mollicutes bacterium]MDY5874499.1 hypothetical protein [Bacilli bacterium]
MSENLNKKSNIKILVIILFIGAIVFLGVGAYFNLFSKVNSDNKSKKDTNNSQEKVDLNKNEYEKPSNDDVINTSDTLKSNHDVNGIILSDVLFTKKGEYEVIRGNATNTTGTDIENLGLLIKILDANKKELDSVTVVFERIPADNKKHSFEAYMFNNGSINAVDYSAEITKDFN